MRQPHVPVSAPLLLACLLWTTLLVGLPGCQPQPPPYRPPVVIPPPPPKVEGERYTIQQGETLYSIAKAYGADWRDIVRANRLNPADLPVGQEIIIPNSTGPAPAGVVSPPPKPEFNSGHPGPIAAESDFLWPVEGELIGKFRQRAPWRRGETNQGIDVRAPEGTAVVAARSGRVNSFSRFPGYGRSVMLEHQDGSITFYGYLGEVLCSHGTWVRQGEVIGSVGQTGLSSGAQLHFRIWQGGKFVNPAGVLK